MDRAAAYAALLESDPQAKVEATRAAQAAPARTDADAVFAAAAPGRPAAPVLVHPAKVARRGLGSAAGRAALVHAIAHIEFNAINLALDAVCRFGGMPADYYADWMRVAVEEAHHFSLLAAHLRAAYGRAYGDFPAHDGLWEMARKTADDVLARMALVPRILEARGLDVTPALRDGLAAHGDADAARILDIILADEIGHVAVGNRWFHHLCAARGLDAPAAFAQLCAARGAPPVRPPLNTAARLAAGFSAAELAGFS
ncbi:MAG: ferritin-like domain-containing protein [Burkholderiales bacterium]|nr:ferritin-like domain-containing protein [Burkholderiales bacterium]